MEIVDMTICVFDARERLRTFGRVVIMGLGRCMVSDGKGDWRLEKALTWWLEDRRSAVVVVSRMVRLWVVDVLGKIIVYWCIWCDGIR